MAGFLTASFAIDSAGQAGRWVGSPFRKPQAGFGKRLAVGACFPGSAIILKKDGDNRNEQAAFYWHIRSSSFWKRCERAGADLARQMQSPPLLIWPAPGEP